MHSSARVTGSLRHSASDLAAIGDEYVYEGNFSISECNGVSFCVLEIGNRFRDN